MIVGMLFIVDLKTIEKFGEPEPQAVVPDGIN